MPTTSRTLSVVVAGGGIAGAEALLALHALAGDRVELTMLSEGDDLVIPAMAVAEPFARGHVQRVALAAIAARAGARLVSGRLTRVEEDYRRVVLTDGSHVDYDALLLAVGARARAALPHATTWWPHGDPEVFGGLLRDLEEGYTKRVAFVVPEGTVWPLPIYELALMTAREVIDMGIGDAELTVVTPEAVPLGAFGADASRALREELDAADVRLETASSITVERDDRPGVGDGISVVVGPSGRRLAVERIVALPVLHGPAIAGTTQTPDGFIRTDEHGRMEGATAVWAAGDATTSPVKFGAVASRQADAAAADIAAHAGVRNYAVWARRGLGATLLTGAAPLRLGNAPRGKLAAEFLGPVLEEITGVAA